MSEPELTAGTWASDELLGFMRQSMATLAQALNAVRRPGGGTLIRLTSPQGQAPHSRP